jgi:hypothetical protein
MMRIGVRMFSVSRTCSIFGLLAPTLFSDKQQVKKTTVEWKILTTLANRDNQRNAVQDRRLCADNQPYGKTFEKIDELATRTSLGG